MKQRGKQQRIAPALWIICAVLFFTVTISAVSDVPDITPLIVESPTSSSTTDTITDENDGKVNINIATVEELMTLPGIGEVLAGRIVVYREEHGAFESVEELLNVSGIGEKKLEAIRDLIIL